MAMYRAVCNIVDTTLASVISRWTGFSPQLAGVGAVIRNNNINIEPDDNWLKDSILWTTPRNRRTLEKRWTRRHGCWQWGIYHGPRLNKRIRVDHKTGEYFEIGKLAPVTYEKVMRETKRIQQKMSDSFGIGTPKDEETLILYKGEEHNPAVKGRVVEMEYERPSFFSKNLLEKEHGKPGGSQETVRPSGLG